MAGGVPIQGDHADPFAIPYYPCIHLVRLPELFADSQRVAYVYKAKREINGSRVRVIWGRISRPHGGNGVVKSKFSSNLPARVFGASCRIVSRASTLGIGIRGTSG